MLGILIFINDRKLFSNYRIFSQLFEKKSWDWKKKIYLFPSRWHRTPQDLTRTALTPVFSYLWDVLISRSLLMHCVWEDIIMRSLEVFTWNSGSSSLWALQTFPAFGGRAISRIRFPARGFRLFHYFGSWRESLAQVTGRSTIHSRCFSNIHHLFLSNFHSRGKSKLALQQILIILIEEHDGRFVIIQHSSANEICFSYF